jgi:predicted nucleotidyltransferase
VQVEEIRNILSLNKNYMQSAYGLRSIGIFGSIAKGNSNSESDIDLLVDLSEPDYLKYIGLQKFLEEKLKMKVDLIRKGPHLSSAFLSSIEDQLLYA